MEDSSRSAGDATPAVLVFFRNEPPIPEDTLDRIRRAIGYFVRTEPTRVSRVEERQEVGGKEVAFIVHLTDVHSLRDIRDMRDYLWEHLAELRIPAGENVSAKILARVPDWFCERLAEAAERRQRFLDGLQRVAPGETMPRQFHPEDEW